MGQKVHPYGFRLGVTKNWRSRWFAKQDYAKLLHEDIELKESLGERLKAAGVSSIEVDRPGNKLRITIRTSRPGIIIGRKGAEIEKLKGDLAKKTKRDVFIDIQEVHRPELDAQLVSESIALQLEKRVAFRRAMRKAVDSALRFGCKGIKVRVSGRLNGAEIARSEWYLQGQLPLHTLRADIDYGFSQAFTTYGVIGVKVWIYKGEVLEGGNRRNTLRNEGEPRQRRPRRDGDRPGGDRMGGDRMGSDRGDDRGSRRNPISAPPVTAPPTVDLSGPIIQPPPTEMQKPAISPIIPPLSAPVAPSWKQEGKVPAVTVPEAVVEAPPADTPAETPAENVPELAAPVMPASEAAPVADDKKPEAETPESKESHE
jgi:small subunit ribosomal protein S3